MGMSEDFVEGLHLACTIHDIGKMSVPAEVLTKPVALNELEKEMLRGHVKVGYDIIKDVEFPFPVADAIYHHHERLDGSGYPQGLKGDEISLGGRIMAVADTVEAMSSNRPYRLGYGIDAALAEVEKGKGSLFDANAVDACLQLFKDGYKLPEVPTLKYTSLTAKTA
jgi:HD-GYP domain-containing protein (c-di-GMP phosphodiesterase class II)